MVPPAGIEPARLAAPELEAGASASSATEARRRGTQAATMMVMVPKEGFEPEARETRTG